MLTEHTGESSESLEGGRGRDRVRRCRLLMSFQDGLEDDRGRDRVRRCRLLMSFQDGLEDDRGRDRVQQCRLLMSFQEGPHQKLLFQGEKNRFSKFCK